MTSRFDATDLDNLARNESVVASYRPLPGTVVRDIAHEAYTKALEYFTKEFAGNEEVQSFLAGRTSILDVKDTVAKAKSDYEAKGQKCRKVLKWLGRLSLELKYYSQVLDMLAQHHPEYVALAWGAVKFVLTGVINHEDLIKELAKALTLIGNVLPGIKLSAQLYQTEQMKDAVASLYAHIIHFFQKAARWYHKSSAGRALSSILKPWELDYQDTVDQIKLCSEVINNLAHGASRAEIRDMHITIQLIHGNLQAMQQKLHNMQVQLDDKDLKMVSQIDQALQMVIASKSINEAVQLDVTDVKSRVYDLQFSDIFKILAPRSPQFNPADILRKHTSLAMRRRRHQISTGYLQTSANIAKGLDLWESKTGSSLFILRSGPRASGITRDHAVDIINYLQNAQCKVFWILSPPSPCDVEPSITNVLKSLVYQIIHYEPNILLRHPESLSSLKILSNRSESEWLDFLILLVSRLEKCFLIVETEDLYRVSHQIPRWTKGLLQVFRCLIDRVEAAGSIIKVLVVTFDNDGQYLSQQGPAHDFVATVQQPRPVPPRLRRGLPRSKLRRYSQQSLQFKS